jgi:hypothetical protein
MASRGAGKNVEDVMDYLAFKLIWWLLAALVFGFVVGWLSCSRSEGDPS